MTDSPNVLMKTSKLSNGALGWGKNIVTFDYGCTCHALSLFIEDMIKMDSTRGIFKDALGMESYFSNVHPAYRQLEIELRKPLPRQKTIKTFSATSWNETDVMLRSVLECRLSIVNIFTNEKTKPETKEPLREMADKNSKAYRILQLSLNWDFWFGLSNITSIFEMYSVVLTSLE